MDTRQMTPDQIAAAIAAEHAARQAFRPLPDGVQGNLPLAYAAFEVVEDRGADYARLDASSIVADNSWNAGVVLGEAVEARGLGRLTGRAGVLRVNGAVSDQGNSDDVGGDPLLIVAWLAG